MTQPTPTRCAVIDPLRKCFLRCKACYYLHGDMESVKPWAIVRSEIDAAIARGNNSIQLTGGEPTIYPEIIELITYCKSKGLKVSMITCGICSESKLQNMIDVGIDDFLISVHGLEATHNDYVQYPNARAMQSKFLTTLAVRGIRPRFNCVINKNNQEEIYDIANWMAMYNPSVVNFINMNPHGEWASKMEETKAVVADLRLVEPQLNAVALMFADRDIILNLRYYPMCRINERFRKSVSNDLHVTFEVNDPKLGFDTNWEWDYSIKPKTFEAHYNWGKNTSNNMESKTGNCAQCDLQNICGGINKAFDTATEGKMTTPVKHFPGDKNDFYYYRRNNILK